MSAPEKEKTEGKSKTVSSAIGLVVILAAVIYGAPRFHKLLDDWQPNKKPIKQEAKNEPSEDKAQSSDELKPWIPQVERQLPTGNDVKFRLIHLRLSADGSRLLLDLEKSGLEKSERFDLVLKRDEFGRFISDNDEIPMTLYPPESPAKKVK